MTDQTVKGNSAESLVEPIRRSFSKDELIKEALEFKHRDEVYAHLDHVGRQEFNCELGLLVQFCTELFNEKFQGRVPQGATKNKPKNVRRGTRTLQTLVGHFLCLIGSHKPALNVQNVETVKVSKLDGSVRKEKRVIEKEWCGRCRKLLRKDLLPNAESRMADERGSVS